MTINCKDVGFMPYEINPDDQFQITFDISTWLDSDTISSVVYSAVDNDGDDATASVINAGSCTNTTTVIKPYVLGGTDGEVYIIKCLVTTTAGDVKAFYIKMVCEEKAP